MVEKTREALPDIINATLEEVEKPRDAMPEILKEVRETNKTLQMALIELKETRHEVPSITENGRSAGICPHGLRRSAMPPTQF